MARHRAPTQLPDGRQVKKVRFHGQYKPGEVLKRVPIPDGGELRLEACPPVGMGAPVVRWVADLKIGSKVTTIESYLQTPHAGFTQLTGEAAEKVIQTDLERMLRLIARKRRVLGPGRW